MSRLYMRVLSGSRRKHTHSITNPIDCCSARHSRQHTAHRQLTAESSMREQGTIDAMRWYDTRWVSSFPSHVSSPSFFPIEQTIHHQHYTLKTKIIVCPKWVPTKHAPHRRHFLVSWEWQRPCASRVSLRHFPKKCQQFLSKCLVTSPTLTDNAE